MIIFCSLAGALFKGFFVWFVVSMYCYVAFPVQPLVKLVKSLTDSQSLLLNLGISLFPLIHAA